MLLIYADYNLSKLYYSLPFFKIRSSLDSALKSAYPVSNKKKIAPTENMSIEVLITLSVYLKQNTSGATYPGVPHRR